MTPACISRLAGGLQVADGGIAASESSIDSGYVSRFSERWGESPYEGESDWHLGQTAWIYDAREDEQVSILLSEHSDGYAFASIAFSSENGLALGSYDLYATDGSPLPLGSRAFAWTSEGGAVDLGALLGDELSEEGWSHLADAIRSDGLDQILGTGRLATGGDLAYLMVVPEPGTALLLGGGLFALAVARRRP